MKKYQPMIRTEKHALGVSVDAHADLARTVHRYRALVRALAGVIFVHFDDIRQADSKCFAIERLFHVTDNNPSPRYAMLDRMFHKFPSYLRRAAIEAAYGAVSSFLSNYSRWQSGRRRRKQDAPPSLARALAVNPALYAGQCIRVSDDWRSVSIKVLRTDGTWGWGEPLRVKGRLKRLPCTEQNRALSPTLLIKSDRALLACPVEGRRPKKSNGKRVCAVDLGINTAATCAIVDDTGTVRARSFISSARHNDQLDRCAARIQKAARYTMGPLRLVAPNKKPTRPGQLSKGFCVGAYRRTSGLNRAVAQATANAIVKFAKANGATTVVFEHLKHFRPKARRRQGSPMRQRFHRWLHRLLVKKAQYLCEEQGIRCVLVPPRGTSSWAYDASGEVTRNKENYSLCKFANGKRYNADLNAAYNIAARHLAKVLGVTTGDRPAAENGKSTDSASRMPIVLADIWRHAERASRSRTKAEAV